VDRALHSAMLSVIHLEVGSAGMNVQQEETGRARC
jgi:hypothetical protein